MASSVTQMAAPKNQTDEELKYSIFLKLLEMPQEQIARFCEFFGITVPPPQEDGEVQQWDDQQNQEVASAIADAIM